MYRLSQWIHHIHLGGYEMIDRSEVSRALAKAIAYKNCGQHAKASQWAEQLVYLLECSEILAAAR